MSCFLLEEFKNFFPNFYRVTKLLKHGDDVNVIVDYGWNNKWNLLMILCDRHQRSNNLIKLLIKYGIDINYKDANGNTALILLCQHINLYYNIENFNSDIEAVKLLIESGADVNIQNCNGNTAFMKINYYLFNKEPSRLVEIIRLLLYHEADFNLKNKKGDTIFTLYKFDEKIMRIISEVQANKENEKLKKENEILKKENEILKEENKIAKEKINFLR